MAPVRLSAPIGRSRPPAAAPGSATGAATGLGQTTATLQGRGPERCPRRPTPSSRPHDRLRRAAVAPRPSGRTTSPTGGADATGLAPGTLYHYRVVATNASGTSYGSRPVFTTVGAGPVAPPPPRPRPPSLPAGHAPGPRPLRDDRGDSGNRLRALPATDVFIPLSAASTVPVGTTIDATAGTLRLTNVRDRSGKLQTGTFWGGAFTVASRAASSRDRDRARAP